MAEADDEVTAAHAIHLPPLSHDLRMLRAVETLADGYKVMWPVYVANLEAANQRFAWQRVLVEGFIDLARTPIVEVARGPVNLRVTVFTVAAGGLTVIGLSALAEYLEVAEQVAALWSLAACAVVGP